MSKALKNKIKLNDSVSVKDFGAVGDGVTDDTASFLAVAATGKSFTVPGGQYRLTGGFALAAGQTMRGDGPAKTILIADGDFDVVSLSSDYASVDGVRILSNSVRTAGAFIKVPTATRGNDITNFVLYRAYVGISITAESVITNIHDGEILNCAPGTGIGIYLNGGNDTLITKVVMDNPAAEQPAFGIYINRTQAIWVSDCDLIRCGVPLGFKPNGLANGYITWCFFSQLALDTSTSNGIEILPSNGAIIKGLFFDNCWSATSNRGVYVASTSGGVVDTVHFTDSTFYNNKLQGVLVDNSGGSVANIEFNNCRAAGNSGESVGTYAGFDIGNNVVGFAIRGCRSGAHAGFSASQAYGVLIGTGCDQYQVMDNNLIGNLTGAAFDNSRGTSGVREVRGNLAYKTQSSGLAMVTSGQNSVTINHGLVTTPTVVLATPSNVNLSGVAHWTGVFTPTTFNIYTSANVAVTSPFSWTASLYN